ncbi:MAG: TetR/AcrR family transcriptional regulator, partial [Burkholderiaceae bacterium]|nr:TetR/AcrR family transcriptional regulator [Burkholderiaceae bacterium]
MTRKAPRRTAERILQTALALFNRYGESGVSTGMIAAALTISPGNLYYHYPAKETLINTLFDQYEAALTRLLAACADARDVEDAWFCLHSLFELIWQYRFLYRDLNYLLSDNRHLEARLPDLLARKKTALRGILEQLCATKKE